MCIKSYNNKKFVEMIFHFLLKNDLFHRRGQKMVPIHFCNYINWDTFLTNFYNFCSNFLHEFLPSFALKRGKNILFFRKTPRKKSDNFIFWDGNTSLIFSLNFFLEFSENNQNTAFQNKKQKQKRYRFSIFERNLLKFKYFLISVIIVISQISRSV